MGKMWITKSNATKLFQCTGWLIGILKNWLLFWIYIIPLLSRVVETPNIKLNNHKVSFTLSSLSHVGSSVRKKTNPGEGGFRWLHVASAELWWCFYVFLIPQTTPKDSDVWGSDRVIKQKKRIKGLFFHSPFLMGDCIDQEIQNEAPFAELFCEYSWLSVGSLATPLEFSKWTPK